MILSLEPTANLDPSGDHLQTVAARLILNKTNVGLYSPLAYSQTNAFLS